MPRGPQCPQAGATRPPVPLVVPPGPRCPQRPRCPSRYHRAPVPPTSRVLRGGGRHPCPWLAVSTSSPGHRAAHVQGRRDGERKGRASLLQEGGAEREPRYTEPWRLLPRPATRSCGPLTRGSFVRPVEEADSGAAVCSPAGPQALALPGTWERWPHGLWRSGGVRIPGGAAAAAPSSKQS